MSRRHQQLPWRAAAWLLYAALLATFVTAAVYAKLDSFLANLYQNFSGPYGSFFVVALITSLYLSSLGRYGGVLFGLQSLTYSFICPAPFTVSAALLLVGDTSNVNPTNIVVVNNICSHAHQYLPFLLFSMGFAFRFASSRPTPDLMPFSRWFARASEYLAFIRFWRDSHGAPIWTPLRFLCFLTILSVGRAHELLRLWQRHRRKDACDASQARRRFRTLDSILIQHLMATSWPLLLHGAPAPAPQYSPSAASFSHGAGADLHRLDSNSILLPPASAGFDPAFRRQPLTSNIISRRTGQPSPDYSPPIRPPLPWSDRDHRNWLQHHLLSTGLYQKLLSKPEQFSFFWTQGSGLLILSGSSLLLSTSLDLFRQILAHPASGGVPNPCRQDPIAWILAIYAGILFLYLLIQCFPALLARIVEADEDAKAEVASCSTAATVASGQRRRPDEDVQVEEESVEVADHGLQSSQTATAGFMPTTSSSAEIHPSHNKNVRTSSVGDDEQSPATESIITSTIATAADLEEEQRYTDTVLQKHLLELIMELVSGTALDHIPEMREADIGDVWKFTTPTVIRALECYETLPYVVLFALLQLTARRLFVKIVAATMRRDSLNASQDGVISTLRRVIEIALTKVVPAMVPVALKLSATDIWRAKTAIVEAEMVLHQSCTSSSSRDVDAETSLVVSEMKSLITSPASIDLVEIDDRNNVGGHALAKKLLMMRISLMLFDLTFSYIDGVLKMDPGQEVASSDRSGDRSGASNSGLVAEHVRVFQCFRKLLLLLKTFYVEPYKANVLHLDENSKVGEASQCQLRQSHGELLKNLEATLEGEGYWNDNDGWFHAHNSRNIVRSDNGGDGDIGAMQGLMRCKARFLVELLLLCLVYPLTHGAPQVETVAGESVYDWVKERKKRTLTMYDDPAATV